MVYPPLPAQALYQLRADWMIEMLEPEQKARKGDCPFSIGDDIRAISVILEYGFVCEHEALH